MQNKDILGVICSSRLVGIHHGVRSLCWESQLWTILFPGPWTPARLLDMWNILQKSTWCETEMDLDVGKTKMSLGSSIFDHFKLTTSWVINPFEVNHCAPNPIIDLSDQITGRSTLIQPKFIDSRLRSAIGSFIAKSTNFENVGHFCQFSDLLWNKSMMKTIWNARNVSGSPTKFSKRFCIKN